MIKNQVLLMDVPIHVIVNDNTRPAVRKSVENLLRKTVKPVQKPTIGHIHTFYISSMLSFATLKNEGELQLELSLKPHLRSLSTVMLCLGQRRVL
jgi:hypothetical protein